MTLKNIFINKCMRNEFSLIDLMSDTNKSKKNGYTLNVKSAQWTQPSLYPLSLLHWRLDSAVASEGRDWGTDSVWWTWGIVLRLGELSWGEISTVGNASTEAMWELRDELHILVASSSENLLLFIKWRGLLKGDTAAVTTVSKTAFCYTTAASCEEIKLRLMLHMNPQMQ